MADPIRETQNVVEVISKTVVPIQETQTVVELLFPTIITIRESQNAVEIIADITAGVRVAQDVIEIITTPIDLSGIYFINPAKTHDTYNGGVTKKIPDPTLRTALFGD